MAAIITEKFRLHNAKQFREVASESGNDMYMFIGICLSKDALDNYRAPRALPRLRMSRPG